MAKLTLNAIGSRYGSIDALNDNSDLIEAAFENTLSRDGTGPNNMESDLDMDSNSIINVANLSAGSLTIGGLPVSPGNINYTGQIKETQVATSGQTVFNLTSISYNPLTNNLSVYVDGVYQNPSRYTETSSTRVTFLTGLHVGAVVDFAVLSLNDLGNTTDSANVTHTQAVAGAVATTVKAKLSEHVSVKDFGAVGDGVTDDTAAIQAALDYIDSVDGGTLLFPKGTYLVTNTVSYTGNNLTIIADGAVINHTSGENTTLDIAGSTTSYTTNGAIAIGATTISMVSTIGISVGDVVYLVANAADTLWCKERSYFYRGEFCEVTAVAAGSITVASPMIDAYITGATVYKLNNKNLKISGLEIRRNNNLACLTIEFMSNVTLENCRITGANERCFYLKKCYNVEVNHCITFASYYVGTGTSYGLVIDSCQNMTITGGIYRAGRHGTTTGGTTPCRFITFNGCIVESDARALIPQWGFDFHSNIQYATVTNVVANNGMFLSGVNITVSNCVVNALATSHGAFTFAVVKDSENTINISNLNITSYATNSAFVFSTVGDGTSYDINVGDVNIAGLNIVQSGVLAFNPVVHFAGSAANKIIYNNLNISGLQATSTVAQSNTVYGLAIAGNSSTLNADAVINISNTYIDCKCRSFQVANGNISAKVNITNSVFKSVAPSSFSARLGLATFNISNTVFDGSNDSLYVECSGGSVTLDNCTFNGMTNRAFYGSALTYAAAFNCKNNTGVAFYQAANGSPPLVIGINSATGARIATGTAAPTTATWIQGDIVYDTTPDAGGNIGWVCVTGGTPGTWKTFGAIAA